MRVSRLGVAAGAAAAALFTLTGCAHAPASPHVQAMIPQGKSYEQFRAEDMACQNEARAAVQREVDEANNRGVGAGLLGAALGAGVGAVAGGGRGAAVGAAVGGGAGTVVGADQSGHEQHSVQYRYDVVYTQCMQAHGNPIAQYHPVTVVQPVYAPPPTVIYQPPPTVIYQQPSATSGYAPPAGAIAPPPNYPPPGQ